MLEPPHAAPGRRPALTRRAALAGALQALALLAACTSLPGRMVAQFTPPAASGSTPASGPPPPAGQASPVAPDSACVARLSAVVAPTPLPYPGYNQPEPETGLHVIGTPHVIDLATYRLEVTGKVARPSSLTFDELRCLPRIEAHVDLECPRFFLDPQKLAGTTIAGLLALARPLAGAETIRLSAVDGYQSSIPVADAQAAENFLAYELNGRPLPASHGFPLRAVFPRRAGAAWTKWLVRIDVT